MSQALFHKCYTISPEHTFLDVLSKFVLAHPHIDVEDWTVYLPTRRACMAFQDALHENCGQGAILMPKILPLGEVDPLELDLKGSMDAPLSSPLSQSHRLILLTELLTKFSYTGHALSFEQRLAVAESLVQVIDRFRKENIPLHTLTGLANMAKGAEHFEQIKVLLSVIGDHWDDILAEQNGLDPTEWQQRMMKAQAEDLRRSPRPVIVAGSLGSVIATKALMKTVMGLPQGALILPGLMRGRDQEQFSAKHPQYFLYRLLRYLNIKSEEVLPLGGLKDSTERSFLSLFEPTNDASLNRSSSITYIKAEDQREEGEIIALMIREEIQKGKKKIFCVSPSSELLSYVATALSKWNLDLSPPSLSSLKTSVLGQFFHLISYLCSGAPTYAHLQSFFLHPYSTKETLWKEIESTIFTDSMGCFSFKQFWQIYHKKEDELENAADIKEFLEKLNFLIARKKNKVLMKEFLEEVEDLILWVTGLPLPVFLDQVTEESSAPFRVFWDDLLKMPSTAKIMRRDIPKIVLKFLSNTSKPMPFMGGIVQLLTPIEARFMRGDFVILGGMNESIWPKESHVDPFFTKAIQEKVGLLPSDHSIGQSAHDFIFQLGNPSVVLTYAVRVKGSPALPSEFLSYLKIFLSKKGLPFSEKKETLDLWRLLKKLPKKRVATPPCPRLGLSAFPSRISVTDVMRLQRDPYSFYARHILKLKPFQLPTVQDPLRHMGIFIHALLEEAKKNPTTLNKRSQTLFEVFFGAPEEHAFLWGKVGAVLEWFKNQPFQKNSTVEVWGELKLNISGKEIILFAKADRIDWTGSAAVLIDYKTGQVPSEASIRKGEAPQLSLEALILKKGNVEGVPSTINPTSIEHWKVPLAAGKGSIERYSGDLDLLIQETEEGLSDLITHYMNQNTAYLSHPYGQKREGDYDHLSRLKEWVTEGGAD